jgi:hypothetical protein
MHSDMTFLDLEVFERATSVFAAKREALHPDAVQALASEIMQRLAESRSAQPSFEVPNISAEEIAAFGRALSEPDPVATLRFIENRRAEGLTSQGVYLGFTYRLGLGGLANDGIATSSHSCKSPAQRDIFMH